MSTPLTDAINALTTYSNEVTGASDTTLSDAVQTLASGYGGGNQNVADLLKTRFEENGYVFTEFVVDSVWGEYRAIPHSLGVIPTNVIAFRKSFVWEQSATFYQLGYLGNSNYGQDNEYNRTYMFQYGAPVAVNSIVFNDLLIQQPSIPICPYRSSWNFCREGTAETVFLRNTSNAIYTKMMLGEWWLGVI